MSLFVPVVMQQYLAQCSQAQLSAIVDVIDTLQQESQDLAQPTNAMAMTSSNTIPTIRKVSSDKIRKRTSKTHGPKKARSTAMGVPILQAKRPLNSFMAFRGEFSRKSTLNFNLTLSQPTMHQSSTPTSKKTSRVFSPPFGSLILSRQSGAFSQRLIR